MVVEFDPTKRLATLQDRGLDFADVARVFDGPLLTLEDDRFSYPEPRFQTYGLLDGRLIMFAWTPIKNGVRVFSLRKCNAREQKKIAPKLD